MPKSIVMESECGTLPLEASRLLSTYGYHFSVLVFCYGALFPFTLDISNRHLLDSWSHISLIPYWDTPGGRMHGIPDIAANILLSVPLGFFGFMYRTEKNKSWALWKWFAIGMTLGLAAEILQLAIPGRSSGTTDMLNNGIGALAGAAMARAFGKRVLDFLTGSTDERRNIYLWMLISSMVFIVGPLDIDPDYFSRFNSGLAALTAGSWHSVSAIGQEWVQMAGFALIGALASRLAVPGRRKRSPMSIGCAVALVALLPLALGCARLLVEAHPPLLHALVIDLLGSIAGFTVGFGMPAAVRAPMGLLVMNLALIAAGLSPFRFAAWSRQPPFQWIPFYEYCSRRTPIALYDLVLTMVSFAMLGGLLQLSLARNRRGFVVAYAMILAAGIEFAQTFLPTRSAGVTDILMACLGAWAGALFCASVQSSRAGPLR